MKYQTHTGTTPVRVLITGGAGFIGTNLADHLLQKGAEVRILDSLARSGTESNLHWLQLRHRTRLKAVVGDVRNTDLVREAAEGIDHVVHLAAQVAVTSSLHDPQLDFQVNAQGTLNVLEAIRAAQKPPSLLFCSTNKVYGALREVELSEHGQRYAPAQPQIAARGIDEQRPLDFYSPYGCSKGAADQYVLDYARSFGLRTVVLRMSCIYGPHQHGNEDQGWVAHFVRCVLEGKPITLYGDGKQVRDILFVEDLVAAMECARQQIGSVCGKAFNIGGGARNTVSLLELMEWLTRESGTSVQTRFDAWRVGDQKYYVSDTSAFGALTGWTARTDVETGLSRLYAWMSKEIAQRPRFGIKREHSVGQSVVEGAHP